MKKKQETQVAILLNLLGPDSLKIYNTLKPKENQQSIDGYGSILYSEKK